MLGEKPVDAPNVVSMVRDLGPLSEDDAMAYARNLPHGEAKAKSGCYTFRCARGSMKGVPVGCAYQISIDECLWGGPIGTVPFLCWVCLYYMPDKSAYRNIKGDTLVVKVDEEEGTLACYTKGCGGPCCYCQKSC